MHLEHYMSEQKLLVPNIAVKLVKNTCKSAQTSTRYWVCKHEIWPENHLTHTKSDCIGFRITSAIPVVSFV